MSPLSKNKKKPFPRKLVALLCAAAVGFPLAARADALESDMLAKAILEDGKIILNVRSRYEYVDEVNKADDAHAITIRTRAGYETGLYHGFGIGGDVEWLRTPGYEYYNSSLNQHTSRPLVADPEEFEINQLFFKLEGVVPQTKVKVGRQRIIWDNHRWVGNVGWRQNEQTFDAARVINTSIPDTEAEYVFINKVHRIFGDNSDSGNFHMHSHLMRLIYSGFKEYATIKPYALLLDFQRSSEDSTTGLTGSTKTFGVRLEGNRKINDDWKVLYTGEYANQTDYGNNRLSFSHNYWFGEGGLDYQGITGKVGYEVMTGNGRHALQTPLATLHLFDGWTDMFLTTPRDGIDDLYGSLGTTIKQLWDIKVFASYHDYNAVNGDADYGHEWQLDVIKDFKVWEKHTATLRGTYANFIAEDWTTNGSQNTGKEIFWLEASFNY